MSVEEGCNTLSGVHRGGKPFCASAMRRSIWRSEQTIKVGQGQADFAYLYEIFKRKVENAAGAA
jgi:hypothetical protein